MEVLDAPVAGSTALDLLYRPQKTQGPCLSRRWHSFSKPLSARVSVVSISSRTRTVIGVTSACRRSELQTGRGASWPLSSPFLKQEATTEHRVVYDRLYVAVSS